MEFKLHCFGRVNPKNIGPKWVQVKNIQSQLQLTITTECVHLHEFLIAIIYSRPDRWKQCKDPVVTNWEEAGWAPEVGGDFVEKGKILYIGCKSGFNCPLVRQEV